MVGIIHCVYYHCSSHQPCWLGAFVCCAGMGDDKFVQSQGGAGLNERVGEWKRESYH